QRPAELADIGRLARRAMRGMVRAARADEGPSLASRLREHLAGAGPELAVIEESWPPYEHVNVQAGLDAWLDTDGRKHEILGVTGFQHQMFGLAELFGGAGEHEPFGLRLVTVGRTNLPCGPDGGRAPCDP